MVFVFAAFILAGVNAAGSPTVTLSQKTLAVHLIHRCEPSVPCVRGKTIDQMQRETRQIWSSLDVHILWIDSQYRDPSQVNGRLNVFLEEGEPPPAQDSAVLASLSQPTEPCGPGLAHVWVRNVRGYADQLVVPGKSLRSLPTALADLMLGRALGRALAHEIGHYLLGTARHSPHGLMRAQLQPWELIDAVGSAHYGLDSSNRQSLLSCRSVRAPQRSDDAQR
jgi:hypothetical protein